MALAPQAARFAYLPISMPSLSGSAARRAGAASGGFPGSGAGMQHLPTSYMAGMQTMCVCCREPEGLGSI